VAGWELALLPGEDPTRPSPGGLHGFQADNSGTGAFVDASALAELDRQSRMGPDGQDPELDRVVPALLARQVVNLLVDQEGDMNVVMFLWVEPNRHRAPTLRPRHHAWRIADIDHEKRRMKLVAP
jgi:hypothetical protein